MLPDEIPTVEIIEIQLENSRLRILPSVHNSLHFCDDSILLEKNPHLLLEFPVQFEEQFFQAIERLPIPTLIFSKLFDGKMSPIVNNAFAIHPGDSVYWLAYKALQRDLPITLVDTYTISKSDSALSMDPASVPFIGWEGFYEKWDGGKHFQSIHAYRSYHIAIEVKKALSLGGNFALVCGVAHVPAIIRYLQARTNSIKILKQGSETPIRRFVLHHRVEKMIDELLQSALDDNLKLLELGEWRLADIDKHSLFVVMGDLPYLVQKFIDDENFDYVRSIADLFLDAHTAYKSKFDDDISPGTFMRLFQYLRNLSHLRGYLIPSMIDILTVANSMVDGDYAFEVYRLMTSFLYLPSEYNRLEYTIKILPDESLQQSIKFTFKVRMPRPILKRRKREDDDPFQDPIPEEMYPGHWQEIWEKYSPYSTVSYPPEDIYIENYFSFLRKRAQEILAEEKVVVEKFNTSLEDGIAWHETLRNWHEKKIYVKRIPKTLPEIGALVVQFHEEGDEEYPHHSTLYAEHDKESDISIVSTNPGDEIIGPGITRIKIAGIISVYPPQHYAVPVPYGSDDLKMKLLYSAVNMSISKVIVLVSPRPPSVLHRHFVSSNGFRLLYVPMQQLTKASLHRLRTMHLLAHPDIREIAKQYIGF